MMQLKEILKNKGGSPVTAPEDCTIGAAIRIMNEYRVGSVMVLGSAGEPRGILTERDVLHLYSSAESDFETMLLKDWMITEMNIGSPQDTVSEVLAIMTNKRFRHMPVVDAGKVIGVISIGDLVKAKLDETAVEAKALRDYIAT